MLGGVACGGDDAEDAPDAGQALGGSGGAGGAGASGAGGGAGSGGNAGGGSGTGGAAGTGGMAPSEEDAGIEPDPGETPAALPTDGNALSVCESSNDCNGDDLECAVFGTYTGYCAEDCATDDDCAEIDGIAPTCDSKGVCVIVCAGSGEGDGACPMNMTCAAIAPTVFDAPLYRCQYPEPKNRDLYETCDAKRRDADCKDGLTCQLFPGLTDFRDSVCVSSCTEATDCDDLGSNATPVCDLSPFNLFERICALDCNEDEDCPGEMTCLAIDLLTSRCGHQL
jgi:hypothetical protein